jgi:hypothetical protein
VFFLVWSGLRAKEEGWGEGEDSDSDEDITGSSAAADASKFQVRKS